MRDVIAEDSLHVTRAEVAMLVGYAQYALEGLHDDPDHADGTALLNRLLPTVLAEERAQRALARECERLRERVATLEASLRRLEWARETWDEEAGTCHGDGTCPACGAEVGVGHTADCWIDAALDEVPAQPLDTGYVCEWPGCFDPATSARRGANWCDRHDGEVAP